MNFKNLIDIFRERVKSGGESSRVESALFRWKILVAVFFVLTVSVLCTSFWIYQDIGRGEFFPNVQLKPPESGLITKEHLDKTINDFSIKSATFDQIRKNHSRSVDPSL